MESDQVPYDDEGELTEEALAAIEEARKTPLSEYISLEDLPD